MESQLTSTYLKREDIPKFCAVCIFFVGSISKKNTFTNPKQIGNRANYRKLPKHSWAKMCRSVP